MANRGDEQKFPFTDDEIKRTYEACEKYGGTYRHKWDGEDMADFISLSILHRTAYFRRCTFSYRSHAAER